MCSSQEKENIKKIKWAWRRILPQLSTTQRHFDHECMVLENPTTLDHRALMKDNTVFHHYMLTYTYVSQLVLHGSTEDFFNLIPVRPPERGDRKQPGDPRKAQRFGKALGKPRVVWRYDGQKIRTEINEDYIFKKW